jgi:hypothetical protein
MNQAGENLNWTAVTKIIKASTEPGLPCPETGCTQEDWLLLWDADGWNELRIQFYGGLDTNAGPIRMKSWFKKPSASAWVPLLQDTTHMRILRANRIGLQVYGLDRFSGDRGTWYRNIRWRPPDDRGNPLTVPSGAHPIGGRKSGKSLAHRAGSSDVFLAGGETDAGG